jgi:uncharacterized membrane protein YphA (DoxX/SURF4 family)
MKTLHLTFISAGLSALGLYTHINSFIYAAFLIFTIMILNEFWNKREQR